MITFFTGVMGAGKTSLLIQDAYNLRPYGVVVLSASPSRPAKIRSRIPGMEVNCIPVDEHFDSQPNMLIDEAQFMTEEQVDKLCHYADHNNIDIRAYGLLSDFSGHIFSGAGRLMALSDRIVTLPLSRPCWCGEQALMNARVVNGQVVHEGPQVVEDPASLGREPRTESEIASGLPDKVDYVPMCRVHWRDKLLHN